MLLFFYTDFIRQLHIPHNILALAAAGIYTLNETRVCVRRGRMRRGGGGNGGTLNFIDVGRFLQPPLPPYIPPSCVHDSESCLEDSGVGEGEGGLYTPPSRRKSTQNNRASSVCKGERERAEGLLSSLILTVCVCVSLTRWLPTDNYNNAQPSLYVYTRTFRIRAGQNLPLDAAAAASSERRLSTTHFIQSHFGELPLTLSLSIIYQLHSCYVLFGVFIMWKDKLGIN